MLQSVVSTASAISFCLNVHMCCDPLEVNFVVLFEFLESFQNIPCFEVFWAVMLSIVTVGFHVLKGHPATSSCRYRRQNREDLDLNLHCRGNLKSSQNSRSFVQYFSVIFHILDGTPPIRIVLLFLLFCKGFAQFFFFVMRLSSSGRRHFTWSDGFWTYWCNLRNSNFRCLFPSSFFIFHIHSSPLSFSLLCLSSFSYRSPPSCFPLHCSDSQNLFS
jgi:hypothetical protein